MVEHQSHPKKMENLNIIIEINEDGEMSDFDISLRNELPYKNTDEFEYVVEEFEKVKEVNHKKLRCLLARELTCFACTAIYRFQLIFVRRRKKQFVLVKQEHKRPAETTHSSQPVVKMLKTVSRTNPPPLIVPHRPDPSKLRQMLNTSGQKTARVGQKTVVMAQNTVRGRQMPQSIVQHRMQRQLINEVVSSEEDIETEVIDSSMVEVQMETNSNSPQPSTTQVVRRRPILPKTSTPNTVQRKIITVKKEPVQVKYEQDSSSAAEDSLKCDLCPKEFHSLRQRQRHRLTHLEQSTVYNCSKCDRPFVELREKENHERIVHGIRPSVRIKQEKKVESIDEIGDGDTGGNEEVLMEIAVEEEVQDGNLYVHDG